MSSKINKKYIKFLLTNLFHEYTISIADHRVEEVIKVKKILLRGGMKNEVYYGVIIDKRQPADRLRRRGKPGGQLRRRGVSQDIR